MNGYEDYFKKRSDVMKGQKRQLKSPLKRRLGRKHTGALWIAMVATALAGGSVWYLFMGGQQKAEGLLNKVSISVFGEAVADDSTPDTAATADAGSGEAKPADATSKSEAKDSPGVAAKGGTAGTAPKVWSDEEITLFTKLEARKKQLDAREESLNKLEEELQKQKEELEKKLAALEDVRGQISAKLEDKVKVDQEKIDALVSVYANMKPAQAAKIIEGLDDDLAVAVLGKMKNKAAADILNQMDATRAENLSERFAGFRQPAGHTAAPSAPGGPSQTAGNGGAN